MTQLPEFVDEVGPDWLRNQDTYFRVLTISFKPTKVQYFWLSELTYFPGVESISVHTNPHSTRDQLKEIDRITTRKRLENGLASCISVVKKARNKLLKKISSDSATIVSDTKSFDVSVYVQIGAESKERLELFTKLVKKAAEKQGVTLTPIQHNHTEAIQSCAPILDDQLDIKYNMSSEATVATSAMFFNPRKNSKDEDG